MVVTVLEAVHLLFDFRMFVVLLAVDTRWLEQSWRIRYRKLLGSTASAAPSDCLEKIIQVPLNLLPLKEELVRRMLAGLTGAQIPAEGTPPPPPSDHADGPRPPEEEPEGRGHRIAIAPGRTARRSLPKPSRSLQRRRPRCPPWRRCSARLRGR
jgi:hypothetical protein